MPVRRVKAGEGALVASAGEYAVMSELLKCPGVLAGLMPRNAPAFDVVAMKGNKTAQIRVKTKQHDVDRWMWRAKSDGHVFDRLVNNDFTVLVSLGPPGKANEYYVLPTRELKKRLEEDFKEWVDVTGRGGRARDRNNRVRNILREKHGEWLRGYKDNWGILWGEPSCLEIHGGREVADAAFAGRLSTAGSSPSVGARGEKPG